MRQSIGEEYAQMFSHVEF